ncbi:CRISPR-associated helicase Cas3' [Bacillus sp. SD088]|uniref:CRISPR-associated helicase Cas3' n=1 Tax=Bacillus sp. SD088 TaxID=2782012 RepID=UPI001A965A3A|nr:CRISPR-associated helicase Cas3' [Bacillus sp. SD088]MBO0992568.1 CRISPR-associated helicase Cas3' [Bacillus sp. SD088]
MSYIAHIREFDKHIQTVEEHLLGVKKLSEDYGEKIGVKHLAGLAGMLHDLGKYTDEFRDYILKAVYDPVNAPKRGSVDHSTAGGKLLYKLLHTNEKITPTKGLVAEIVGNAIISHHSYLQDFLNSDLESPYLKRVRDKELGDFGKTKKIFFGEVISEKDFHAYVDQAAMELEKFISKDLPENSEKQLMFLTKFIFSMLIDADRTNTRLFEENQSTESFQHDQLFETYYKRLMNKLSAFKDDGSANNPINRLRTEMSEQCDAFAEKPSGIYTLSIPTGGGKTLASLRYALKHAMLHKKKRIIYVIPYTSIIEQNAAEVRRILKDSENILEHHSNVIEDVNDNDEFQDGLINEQQKLKLAKDNWDAPIIFTTMVQFLNVFYAKGSRNIRRLHNISDSVIIFDEVQKVPTKCVSLFNYAVNFLKIYGNSSMLLCTATQPALDYVEKKLEINSDAEMINQLDQVIDAFKRIEIIDQATTKTYNNESLVQFVNEKMNEVQSILIILNTKTVVKNLYTKLKEEISGVPIYHLSTSMCSAHRSQILEEVKQHLKAKKPVICVSTQLIEAGVDVSFQCVIRSLAGLDSIAQAAGRCNRHGETGLQNVYVIDHEEEALQHLKEIEVGKRISKRLLIDINKDKRNHGGNVLSNQAMERYFQEFYTDLRTDLDYLIPKFNKNMTEILTASRENCSFHRAYISKNREPVPLFLVNGYLTAAENFHVIENNTTSVLVPFGKGKEIIAELAGAQKIDDLTQLLRKAQQYTINLYTYEKELINKNAGLVSLFDGKIMALKEGAYNEEFGLEIQNDSQFDFMAW